MRSPFKIKRGIIFYPAGIWTVVYWNQMSVCYQRAMLTLLESLFHIVNETNSYYCFISVTIRFITLHSYTYTHTLTLYNKYITYKITLFISTLHFYRVVQLPHSTCWKDTSNKRVYKRLDKTRLTFIVIVFVWLRNGANK